MLQRITILFFSIILLKTLEAIWCGGEWTGRCPKFHVCLQANPKHYASHKCIEHEKNAKYPNCALETCKFPVVCCLARNRSSYCSADPSCFDEMNGNFMVEMDFEDGNSTSKRDLEVENSSNDLDSQNERSTVKSSEDGNFTTELSSQNGNTTSEWDPEDGNPSNDSNLDNENSTAESDPQDRNFTIEASSQNENSTIK